MAIDIPLSGDDVEDSQEHARRIELAQWVMEHVQDWRRVRNSNFQKKWAEYYRLWRGFWDPADRNKDHERSKLIAPALQQAVEMTVAEMEEATFGRDMWLDISDDYADEDKADVEVLRDQLLDEIDCHGTKASVSEAFLNGALFGTGIGKIMIGREPSGEFKCWVVPVAPNKFVIDPVAKSVDEALGCAHELNAPRHKVLEKMANGIYYQTTLGDWQGDAGMFNITGEMTSSMPDNNGAVFVTEYHGLVPERLLDPELYKKEFDKAVLMNDEGAPEIPDEPLVEAIVTVANEGVLLRAIPNPFETVYGKPDRSIIAYPHETVPDQFWGRGVSEKGYNPQKALDAELRARIDALGLLTYPVMGIDATRIPRGMDFRIKPGKSILTQGRPSEILEPITFGNLNPATFQQSSDLERMVQMGTGAMDTAISTEENRRNETVGGMSMMQGGFIKRAKRTMQNVERLFLGPMVKKMLNRYCQFDEDRFPQDFKFRVYASMGVMAKEQEQQIYAQLLNSMGPDEALKPLIMKAIIENSSVGNRSSLLQALEAASQPDPQAQQMQQMIQQLQLENAQLENDKLQAEIALKLAQAEAARATAEYTGTKNDLEDEKIEIMAAQTVLSNKKIDRDSEAKKMQAMQQSFENDKDRKAQSESDDKKAKAQKSKGKSKK